MTLGLRSTALDGIAHGFFGRKGGVSTGAYASLNCGPGSDDAPEAVAENRRRALRSLGPDLQLASVYQIHSPKAVSVTRAWEMSERPQADAMVTATPGIALSILTADCAPVLFADPNARVIGAAHAGWKGAIGGIIESTLHEMESLGATRANIRAAVGPSISQPNYEVGPEFREIFLQHDSANARFFIASDRADHFRFDLEGYVVHTLHDAGIPNPAALSACTYAREDDYFSFRRATHRREPDNGRQISLIALT
ncbi:MAG TPA: peptidoglycan editing factor PgeF [Rhizomicrobium sp.]|nr:peptidoglycan editing factor PgeF [Rhizomicrobium sp.]